MIEREVEYYEFELMYLESSPHTAAEPDTSPLSYLSMDLPQRVNQDDKLALYISIKNITKPIKY